jgi:hypothetical protein
VAATFTAWAIRSKETARDILLTEGVHSKGLEFRAVVAMACDDGVIPSNERASKGLPTISILKMSTQGTVLG